MTIINVFVLFFHSQWRRESSDNRSRPKWHTHLCSPLASPTLRARSTRSPYIMYISNKKKEIKKKRKKILKHNKSIVAADFQTHTHITPEGILKKNIWNTYPYTLLYYMYTRAQTHYCGKCRLLFIYIYMQVNKLFKKFWEFLEHATPLFFLRLFINH